MNVITRGYEPKKKPADPGTKNMFQVPVDNLEIWHFMAYPISRFFRSSAGWYQFCSDREDLVFPKLLGDTVVNGKS